MAFDAQKVLREIAKGNESAYVFMLNFLGWVHSLDDLIDQDHVLNLDQILESQLCLIDTVSSNEFYQKHRTQLFPLFLTGLMAYRESERFKTHESVIDRITSQVLKSQYQDIFFFTAFLVGGWSHMIEMSRKFRDYDFDPVPPPKSV